MSNIDFKHLGYIRGCMDAGLSPSDIVALDGFHKRASNQDYGAVGRKVATLLYNLAQAGGRGHTKTAHLWKKLAEADPWPTKFTPVVLGTLAHVSKVDQELNHGLEKSAIGRPSPASIPAAGSSLLRLFGLAALAGGSTLGGGHWLMSHQVRENRPKVEALRAKADHYARLSREAEAAMEERQEAAKLKEKDEKDKPKRYNYGG